LYQNVGQKTKSAVDFRQLDDHYIPSSASSLFRPHRSFAQAQERWGFFVANLVDRRDFEDSNLGTVKNSYTDVEQAMQRIIARTIPAC
jgi:hypothetical protein